MKKGQILHQRLKKANQGSQSCRDKRDQMKSKTF